MIDRVKACHVGKQGLGRANITCGLVAAYMLLTGLQRHAVGGLASSIHRDTNNASWGGTNQLGLHCKKRCMRAAKPHGHAKALGVAQGHIGTHFTRRLGKHEGKQVAADR